MIPRVQVGASELVAVPAVHNRSVFAEAIYRASRDEAARPDAIAVELSHDTVEAVVKWFKELGIRPSGDSKLQCMLGLAKPNRRIHPRYKEAALRLQELHGRPLHEIAPEVLRRELNFAPASLTCLSPTDSIIEGIRSAVELSLPVYGIDLGEVANAERGQPMIQDPVFAQANLTEFVNRNSADCFSHRDAVVDERREQVMAARLKRLLLDHRRVLFTGGIGHWHTLRQRLADPTVAAANVATATERELQQRVVVAPSMAVFQMDLLPVLTAHYESVRSLAPDAPERRLDLVRICRASLAEACSRAEARNPESLPALCQYLSNLSLLNQRRTPDLFTILAAARDMVSRKFTERLGEVLVTEALDWARKEQWPGLPYLRAMQEGGSGASAGLQAELEQDGKVVERFYIRHRSESRSPAQDTPLPRLPDPAPPSDKNDPKRQVNYTWVWPPCESLLFGTAYAASDIVDRKIRERCPEPFTGSLQEGVDVKATLRALIRGEQRIQVRTRSAPAQTQMHTEGDNDPTVFIFEREAQAQDGHWDTLLAGGSLEMRQHVENQRRFDEITKHKGHSFIACVQFCAEPELEARLRKHVSGKRYLYGVTVFGNPSLNHLQSARWLEACDYTGCPILRFSGVRNLFQFYRDQYKIVLCEATWVTSLIRIAVPFAKRRVTVILPKGQMLEPRAVRDAAARRVTLETVPLSRFSAKHIETIRNQYLVRPFDVDRMEYPDELQSLFGESPRKHLELLPARIRSQLELPT